MFCCLRVVGFLCVSAVSLILTQSVAAHGGHDERIKLKLQGNELIFDTHIPARLLREFDMDGNKKLTAKEFRSSVDAIKAWIADHIAVRTASGTAVEPIYFDIPVSEGDMSHDDGVVNFVRILQRYNRPESHGLTLGVTLFTEGSKRILFYKDGKLSRKTLPVNALKMVLE